MNTDPYKILHKRAAKKEELRAALACALGVPLPTWAKADESLVDRCRMLFSQAFAVATGNDYRFGAKDYKALTALVGKIADATSEKNPRATSADIENAFVWFLRHLPKWYRGAGFSVCIINGKFNEIIAAIKHETRRSTHSSLGVSKEYLAGIAKDLYRG